MSILELFSFDFTSITFVSIRINLFFVWRSGFLGFVVYKDSIQIDCFKISIIVALNLPTNIIELQRLQGKENLLRHFVCNFTEKMHAYM